eukprot:786137_1
MPKRRRASDTYNTSKLKGHIQQNVSAETEEMKTENVGFINKRSNKRRKKTHEYEHTNSRENNCNHNNNINQIPPALRPQPTNTNNNNPRTNTQSIPPRILESPFNNEDAACTDSQSHNDVVVPSPPTAFETNDTDTEANDADADAETNDADTDTSIDSDSETSTDNPFHLDSVIINGFVDEHDHDIIRQIKPVLRNQSNEYNGIINIHRQNVLLETAAAELRAHHQLYHNKRHNKH